MSFPYIAQTVYPKQLDTDYNLYKVANTAESTLSQNLDAWSTSIYINPVSLYATEIWNESGFVNIEGELIYYNSVEKDYATGKVISLKDCIRNYAGSKPVFHPSGTWVRGYIIADHHNQLSKAIVNIQNFAGTEDTSITTTLDWKIKILAEQNLATDDYGCPQTTFFYTIESSDPMIGTTISYTLDIIGTFSSFTIDFGDGTTESTLQQGTHEYPPNYAIDPRVTVTSSVCEVAQSSPTSNLADEIQTQQQAATIPLIIPAIPDFPTLDLTIGLDAPIQLQNPPIVYPCIDVGPFGPIVVPSTITLANTQIIPSNMRFANIESIPSTVTFTNLDKIASIPSTITFNNPTGRKDFFPSTITTFKFPDIPEVINISPITIDLINAEYCVNCTSTGISDLEYGEGTKSIVSNKGCKPCLGAIERITKVQVVIYDFFVQSEFGASTARYDYVKMLLVNDQGAACLLMGSGKWNTKPSINMSNKITITFDDNAANNIYDFTKPLESGSYKPSPNENTETNDAGLATLDGGAPNAPYAGSLATFIDGPLTNGAWKIYMVVGKPPESDSVAPFDDDLIYGQGLCTGTCTWQAVIVAITDSNPPHIQWGWAKTADNCSEDCGCQEPKEYPTEGAIIQTFCNSKADSAPIVKVPTPSPEPVVYTTASFSKACVRVYYNRAQHCALTPVPTPTPTNTPTSTPTPTASASPTPTPTPSKTPRATYPPFPTFPPFPPGPPCLPHCPTPTPGPGPQPTAGPQPTPGPDPELCAGNCWWRWTAGGWINTIPCPDGCSCIAPTYNGNYGPSTYFAQCYKGTRPPEPGTCFGSCTWTWNAGSNSWILTLPCGFGCICLPPSFPGIVTGQVTTSSCISGAGPTATPLPSPTPTPTPFPSATINPDEPTATPEPSSTPSPTQTPVPTSVGCFPNFCIYRCEQNPSGPSVWVLEQGCPYGCGCVGPGFIPCEPSRWGTSLQYGCTKDYAGFSFDSNKNISQNDPVMLLETKVEKVPITRPKLCKYAGRKPLHMIKENCGACSVRTCDIFGTCNHTANLPDMPEVKCCQTCPYYDIGVNPPVNPLPINKPTTMENLSEEFVREIEIPFEIVEVNKIPTSLKMGKASDINIKSALDIAQAHLDINKQVKIVPKNSTIKVDVENLLEENGKDQER